MGRSLRHVLFAGILVLAGFIFPISAAQQTTPADQGTASESVLQNTGQPASSNAVSSTPSTTPSPTPDLQTQPGTLESSAVLKATTRLVMVDVVVTDNHGRHIPDLKPSDFTVLEDGREQRVRAFSFLHPAEGNVQPSGTNTDPASAKPQSLKLPPNVFTNVSQMQRASAINVLLLDALNTSIVDQSYVRQQVISYLERMPENQPIAIFTLTTRLRMLQDFTTDPKVLKQAVKNYRGRPSIAMDNPGGGDVPAFFPEGTFESMSQDMQDRITLFDTESAVAQTDMRIRMTMDALQSVARLPAGYPGRKNLIWLSEAFPLAIYPDSELGFASFAGARNYDPDVLAAANALVDAQVAVYPVDARGLAGSSLMSAASRGNDSFGRSRVSSGPAFARAVRNDAATLMMSHQTMDDLAECTGGKAFYNRNDLDNLVRNSVEDGSTYYLLGYYPANKDWNGKFRKIKVKVDRPNAKVRYRLGYYATEPDNFSKEDIKTQNMELTRVLNPETPISTAVGFTAAVLPPSLETHNKTIVNYNIDAHALSFELGNDGLEHANVECLAQVYSPKGKPVAVNAQTLSASLKAETFKQVLQHGFPCSHDLDLTAGKYFLRLAVRDDRTGLVGTANAKVTVPETVAATTVASPERQEEKK